MNESRSRVCLDISFASWPKDKHFTKSRVWITGAKSAYFVAMAPLAFLALLAALAPLSGLCDTMIVLLGTTICTTQDRVTRAPLRPSDNSTCWAVIPPAPLLVASTITNYLVLLIHTAAA